MGFVRYSESGPCGAYRGLIGEKIGKDKRGWIRVRFGGLIGNFDAQFLETVSYWSKCGETVSGPFDTWAQAVDAIRCAMGDSIFAAEGWSGKLPAMRQERDSAIAALEAALPSASGHSATLGGLVYRIAMGGPHKPPFG